MFRTSNKKAFPALSISSWFCVPEHGMNDLEILCRASAFLVKAINPSFKHKFHVLTVSHAVAPWKWPKYYPEEWLQQVNEKHTHYTIEMRHDQGEFCSQTELIPQAFHHNSRDFTVMHIENESKVMEELSEIGLNDSIYSLAPSDTIPLQKEMKLKFHGHEVSRAGFSDMDTDDRKPIPSTFKGIVNKRSDYQVFARTLPRALENGMCGGPVLFAGYASGSSTENNTSSSREDGRKRRGVQAMSSASEVVEDRLVGLVEGIVPSEHSNEDIRGNAVFVEANEMREFLVEIEAGQVVPVLGGQVMETVGIDQDPDKMDWQKHL